MTPNRPAIERECGGTRFIGERLGILVVMAGRRIPHNGVALCIYEIR
jgi:hypothetical protein